MNIKKLKLENAIITKWSGGTTTELFIYPPEADFQKKNFAFRLSTATVEVETSDFTPLQDVSRVLMVLDGEITLFHEHHHTKRLSKFDVDQFEGGWNTSSKGKCIDFNLMTIGNTKGQLNSFTIEKNQTLNYTIDNKWDWLFISVYVGEVNIELTNKTHTLCQGDLLVISQLSASEISVKGVGYSELVMVQIKD